LVVLNMGGRGGGVTIGFEERIVAIHGKDSREEERRAWIGRIRSCYLPGTVKHDGMEVCSVR
jgi:hypothetical protein